MRSRKTHRGLIDLRGGARPKHAEPVARRTPELRVIGFRRSPLRAKRRKKQILIALSIFVGIVAIGYGVHVMSYAPRLTINDIQIEGAKELPPELIRTYVESVLDDGSYHVLARDNIFVYPKAVIERAVASYFPRISAVEISRESLFSQTIRVSISERTAYAIWCADPILKQAGDCYLFDESGFIFAHASSSAESVETNYVFTGGVEAGLSPVGKSLGGAAAEEYRDLLVVLESRGYRPRGVESVDEKDYLVPLESGFILKTSRGTNATKLLHNLELVLASDSLVGKEEDIEYIDLRFGNRVYYKLLSEDDEGQGVADDSIE